MKTIKINGKDYKIEFTFEASLYNECIETTIDLVSGLAEMGGNPKDAIKKMSSIPATTLTMFYAGLLEHHNDEVKSIDDSKALAKIYFAENKDTEEGTFIGLMNFLMGVMEEDGFFRQMGLDKIMEMGAQATSKPRKVK